MVQLELDPKFIYPERAAEIEFLRSTILRRRVLGGSGEWRKEKRFSPISFDVALSSLLNISSHYLGKQTDAKGHELDLLVGRALKRTLPYLQGERGHFESLGDFSWRMFMSITRHIAIDHYHNESRGHKEIIKDPDGQLPTETRKRKAEGFQPTLFRLSEKRTKTERALDKLLADLEDPFAVLGSDYLNNFPKYRQRALELRFKNPQFTSKDIIRILVFEGYREFEASAIRVWVLRFKKAQKQYLLST